MKKEKENYDKSKSYLLRMQKRPSNMRELASAKGIEPYKDTPHTTPSTRPEKETYY
jgi:hypothetical protein